MSEELDLKKKDTQKWEEELREKLVFIYINEFTEESTKEFQTQFWKAQRSGQTVLPIQIDSWGGEGYSVLAMIDLVKSSKIPVATIATGKAMSAGSFLLAAGSPGWRYASPNCSIMVHGASSMTWGKTADMKIDIAETERMEDVLMKQLDENCKRSDGYFKNLLKENLNSDLYFTAEQAKEHGLIDNIKIPRVDPLIVTKTILI